MLYKALLVNTKGVRVFIANILSIDSTFLFLSSFCNSSFHIWPCLEDSSRSSYNLNDTCLTLVT
jgi:hypothetical protein